MDRSDPIRILLIDDDQGDFQMTLAMVGQIEGAPISLDWVPSYQEGLDAFRADEHDVYLVDYFLEDRDGLELVRPSRSAPVRKRRWERTEGEPGPPRARRVGSSHEDASIRFPSVL